MSKPIFLVDLKSNWQIIAFITALLLVYVFTSTLMYNPASVEKLEQMFTLLPEAMLKAFGFDTLGTDITGYLAHYLYGFIAIVFPLIYVVISANKLIAKHVDSGSMAYILSAPVKRVTVAFTQGAFHFFGLLVIFVVNIGALIIVSEVKYPGALQIGRFIVLNFVTIMTLTVSGAIGFFFSCLCNDSRNALAFGAGIPIAFFVFKMVSEIGKDLEALKYLSVFSLIQIDRILDAPVHGVGVGLILLGVCLALYGAGTVVFSRKSLAI